MLKGKVRFSEVTFRPLLSLYNGVISCCLLRCNSLQTGGEYRPVFFSFPLIRKDISGLRPEPIRHIANRQVSINNVIVPSLPRSGVVFLPLSCNFSSKIKRNPSIAPYFACVCILHHTLAFSQCHPQNICNSQSQQTIP